MALTDRWKTAAPSDAFGAFPSYRIQWLSRVMYGNRFEFFIVAIIIVNAIALASLTIPEVQGETREILIAVDQVAFWIYVTEVSLRVISYGTKPWMFFRSGWNIFDFLIIGVAPFFQGQSVVLRLLRLFRLVRIFRFLPEVRILTASVIKSIPPLASLTVLIGFLLFLYAMTGHYMFGAEAPESWGDIGAAMQSLFILLTLENFPNYFLEAMEITPFAILFFLSYVFVIVFTILNILIGIVLHAMDQAREEDITKTREIKVISSMESELSDIAQAEPQLADEVQRIKSELKALKAQIRGG